MPYIDIDAKQAEFLPKPRQIHSPECPIPFLLVTKAHIKKNTTTRKEKEEREREKKSEWLSFLCVL